MSWPTFLVFGPLFRVTDVTHVTRKWVWAKKVGQGCFDDLDFSLKLQRKVGVGHFL
nr:MAG TPA: hypothetical protein [Caudoviricetes sp.]